MSFLSDFLPKTPLAAQHPQAAAPPDTVPHAQQRSQRNPLAGVDAAVGTGSPQSQAMNQVPTTPNAHTKEAIQTGAHPVPLLAMMGGVGATTGTKGATPPRDIHWTEGKDGPNMPDMQKRYNIQSVQNKDGSFTLTSNGIRMQVTAADNSHFDKMFKGKSDDEINRVLDGWRKKKDGDDRLAYGTSTADLKVAAQDPTKMPATYRDTKGRMNPTNYYESEQHVMWATAASARTGGRVPPEFFMDFDPTGGTAGNGPNILHGGNGREPMSTISMAHDTDWSLGRYMGDDKNGIGGVGPLAGLYGLKPTEQYQMARMGSAGLFNGLESNILPGNNRPDHISVPKKTADAADSAIYNVVENAAKKGPNGEVIYRDRDPWNARGAANYQSRQGVHGWSTQFTQDYAREADVDAAGGAQHVGLDAAHRWDPSQNPAVHGDAVGWLNQHALR